MKRIFLLLLAMLSLYGCGAEPATPTESLASTEAVNAENVWQTLSDGLQEYPLTWPSCGGVRLMGDDLLLFCGSDTTTLVRLPGQDFANSVHVQLDVPISASDASVQVSEKGVTYYDALTQELVFLDTSIKEVSRLALPEEIQGAPILSADRKSLYYCTADALRVLDIETGLEKLLKEMSFDAQTLTALHCGDTILQCDVTDSAGNTDSLLVSTQTGETLWETSELIDLTTNEQTYFAVNLDGAYPEMLYGSNGEEPLALHYDGIYTDATALLDSGCAIVSTYDESLACTNLEYFDLDNGSLTATAQVPGEIVPHSFCTDGAYIFFLRTDDHGTSLCRWMPTTTAVETTAYLAPRNTAENPDLEGIAQCEEKAAKISKRYGVQIHLWRDAVSVVPDGYTLEAEYQVPMIMDCLDRLDNALSCYPEEFLVEAAHGTSSEILQICLLRSICDADGKGNPDCTMGLQFWDDREDAYVFLIANSTIEQAVHHQLFHVIDSRVLSSCSAYDNWDDLNPEGFSYDNSYLFNQYRQEDDLLSGSTRAFVDTYSMSFPKEDRARIMQYAMMDGSGELFAAPTMQAKLRQLCVGIRQAFGLEDSTGSYCWEQYVQGDDLTE